MPVQGSCHCGKTRFEVTEAPTEVTRCTCSYCSKRGGLWAYYKPDQFRLLTPEEDVATYRWNTGMIAHHFCATCGCTTYGVSPDWVDFKPDFDNPKLSINARLLDNFDLDAIPVTVIDGKNLW
ncbi:GFA family protein [Lysobacter silvisoli]|uniref:GFA family protein n=1 Tax=Lysobacter silvisoli TaxID=2293254 RepID=A0A371JZY4_9GAMM|nr:GFA family protein [Lysobacter silvisoli]RDZ27228.1 GFA family protein [Lysobacter silvisoli]